MCIRDRVGPGLPDEMIPSGLKDKIMSDNYEIIFVCSDYKTATEEVNTQITEVEKIVKSFSPESMVVGEAPLTKDLELSLIHI